MSARDAVAAYTALYGPKSAAMLGQLPELADRLHAALYALHDAPSESAATDLAVTLAGARVQLGLIAVALRREGDE